MENLDQLSVMRLMKLLEKQQEQLVKLSGQNVALSESLFRVGSRVSRLESIVRRTDERELHFEGKKNLTPQAS